MGLLASTSLDSWRDEVTLPKGEPKTPVAWIQGPIARYGREKEWTTLLHELSEIAPLRARPTTFDSPRPRELGDNDTSDDQIADVIGMIVRSKRRRRTHP